MIDKIKDLEISNENLNNLLNEKKEEFKELNENYLKIIEKLNADNIYLKTIIKRMIKQFNKVYNKYLDLLDDDEFSDGKIFTIHSKDLENLQNYFNGYKGEF